MNILKTTLAMTLACLLFCSCVDTPDSLKKEETKITAGNTTLGDDLGENINSNSAENVVQIERGDLNAMRNQLELDMQNTYQNIDIIRARIGDGDTMPTYSVTIGGNPDYDFNALIEYLYIDRFDVTNEKYYTKNRTGDIRDSSYPAYTEPTYNEYENAVMSINVYEIDIDRFSPAESTDYTLSSYYYSIGNVWGSQSGGGAGNSDYYWFEAYSLYDRCDLEYEKPTENLSYKMSDGEEWNANDAIAYVENFWNKYLAPSDLEEFEYSVKTLYVIQLGDDVYGYLFDIQRKDKNGNYYDVERYDNYVYTSDSEQIVNGNPFIYTNNQMTWCAEKEVITRYIKNYSVNFESTTDSGDDLLTLGAASRILSDSLAPNIDLMLIAELNYAVVCKGYPYYQIWEYPYFSNFTCFTTCDFEIKPFWCYRPEQCTQIGDSAEIYFIDAVTGALSILKDGYLQSR